VNERSVIGQRPVKQRPAAEGGATVCQCVLMPANEVTFLTVRHVIIIIIIIIYYK